MSGRPRSEDFGGSPGSHVGLPRRPTSTTSVFPATGMSTYYSAGKRGSSLRSSASSSTSASPIRRPDVRRDSPASTVSSVSDVGADGDDMTSKFRTVVKLSSNAERDNLFQNNTTPLPGKQTGYHGNEPHTSSEDLSPGVSKQTTPSYARDTTATAASVSSSSSLTSQQPKVSSPPPADRDAHSTASEHSTNSDTLVVNGTNSDSTTEVNMARPGYLYDTGYSTPGSTNGIDTDIVPPVPPRSRKPSYTGTSANRNHAQVNGSTGVASDLSDSLDSDTSSLNQECPPYERFHMDQQMISTDSDGSSMCYNGYGTTSDDGQGSEVEAHPFLVGQRNVLKPHEPMETKILSSKGTVRGLKNLVRAGIATFAEKKEGSKNYRQIDKGKLVVYTTSVMIVRDTYDRCIKVKKILHTHMVKFEERDIFMSRENHRELNERLGTVDMPDVDVPQVFADGQHIGGCEELERMNETGELRTILKQFQRVCRTTECAHCGGYRYTPCSACHGSKKSTNRNFFTEEFYALRCTTCDENGLVRCDICFTDDVTAS